MRTEIIKMENSSSCEIDLIEVRDGQAVTSSLVVAKYFGKAHKDLSLIHISEPTRPY